MHKNEEIYSLARQIYLSRIKSCYGREAAEYAACINKESPSNLVSSFVKRFPDVSLKEFRTMLHHGQAHIDISIDQARHILKYMDDLND